MTRWNVLVPDRVELLERKFFRDSGSYTWEAPEEADFVRISAVGVGGQGEHPGGNGAFSHSKRHCTGLEVLVIQVGRPGTGMTLGDSWVRRASDGEVLCYADRGRGSNFVQGAAINCIGDIRRSGVINVASGSDAGDVARLGFGGRYGVSATRAPGPGGGGMGTTVGFPYPQYPAGQGAVALEFYAGDPGAGY